MLATALAALWLVFVTITVVPSRDPGHLRLWSSVTSGCFLFTLVSGTCLRVAFPSVALRAALILVSALLLAAGLYGISSMLRAPAARFEGYVLLLGAIFSLSGLIGILYGALVGRFAPAREAVN